MIGLVGTLAWCAVAVFGLVTVRQVGRAWFAHHAAVRLSHDTMSLAMAASSRQIAQIEAESALAVAQVQFAAPVTRTPENAPPVVIPDDLEAWLNSWSDEFARDDQRGFLKHQYRELDRGDQAQTWQAVRRAVGIGELPA